MSQQSLAAERRPVSVVIALIALWFIGMNSASEGFATIELVRNPLWSAPSAIRDIGLEAVRWRAYMQATREHGSLLLPIGLAQLMLGAMLVFISIRALIARRASLSFMLQIVVANAAVAVIGYALRQPIRGAIVEAIVASGAEQRPAGSDATAFADVLRSKWWWSFRIALGLQLAALTASGYALARRQSRQLFARANAPTGE
jgi:hypothetical protein